MEEEAAVGGAGAQWSAFPKEQPRWSPGLGSNQSAKGNVIEHAQAVTLHNPTCIAVNICPHVRCNAEGFPANVGNGGCSNILQLAILVRENKVRWSPGGRRVRSNLG